METYRTCKLPHPYPDKQTKDLYLCNELNLDLLVELEIAAFGRIFPSARRARIWSASGTKKTRTGHTAFKMFRLNRIKEFQSFSCYYYSI